MNPEDSLTPREELELKITALLLGELGTAEAQLVRQALAEDEELAKLHRQLEQTLDLVKAASAGLSAPTDPSDVAEPLHLPALKRNTLLAHFKIISPKPFQQAKPTRSGIRLVEVAAIVALIALLAALLLPSLGKAKSKAKRVTILNNLKQVELAKHSWAEDHGAASDQTPTRQDLEPYLGRWPESVDGESYVIGDLSEPAAAELQEAPKGRVLGEAKMVELQDGRQVYRISDESMRGYYADQNRNTVQGQPVGNPEWVGALDHQPSSSSAEAQSKFIARYATTEVKRRDESAAEPFRIALPSQSSSEHGNFGQRGTGVEPKTWGMGAAGGGGQVPQSASDTVLFSRLEGTETEVPMVAGSVWSDESARQIAQVAAEFHGGRPSLNEQGQQMASGSAIAPTDQSNRRRVVQGIALPGEPASKAARFAYAPTYGEQMGRNLTIANESTPRNQPSGGTTWYGRTKEMAEGNESFGLEMAGDDTDGGAKIDDVAGVNITRRMTANKDSGTMVGGGALVAGDGMADRSGLVPLELDLPAPAFKTTPTSVPHPARPQSSSSTRTPVNYGGSLPQPELPPLSAPSLDYESPNTSRSGLALRSGRGGGGSDARGTLDGDAYAGYPVQAGQPVEELREKLNRGEPPFPTEDTLTAGMGEYAIAQTEGQLGLGTQLAREPDLSYEFNAGALGDKTESSVLVQDGKLLYELGRFDEAETKLKEALKENPSDGAAHYYMNLVDNQAAHSPESSSQSHLIDADYAWQAPAKPDRLPLPTAPKDTEGIMGGGGMGGAGSRAVATERKPENSFEQVEALSKERLKQEVRTPDISIQNQMANLGKQVATEQKLNDIQLDSMSFDGVPLGEVLRIINEETRRLDPLERGVDFILTYDNVSSETPLATFFDPVSGLPVRGVSIAASFDPITGLPLSSTSGEQPPTDLGGIPVRLEKTKKGGSLSEVLQEIANSTDQPVTFSIEDYGVVISRKEGSSDTPSGTIEQEHFQPKKRFAPALAPQPEVRTAENAFSTFSLNVSDVSFKLAAASLEQGLMPEVSTIRSEEFINAFDYRDPAPTPGQPLAFAWERARYPFAHNRDLLRFSVQTAAKGREAGRPLNLVLLLDNSGSMERSDRVRIIRECLNVLGGQLAPQDRISVVTFARTARLWLDGVPGVQAPASLATVGQLTPEGGTNLEEAMNLAYATAQRHYLADGVNRVVLLTDGAANLGNVDPESLKREVEAQRKQGIALDCFGIGWEGYNDDLLEVLTRNGDGRYGFVNTPQAASSEFGAQLAGALQVAASDVKVQVEFNPHRVKAYRQIGYAKHQLTKEQFRDNTVDAAEIGAAESGNALYVIETNPQGQGPIATVRARFKVPATGQYQEYEWPVPYVGESVALEDASAAMRLAATASAFSEWLVASPYAGEITTDRLLNILRSVPEVFGADPRPKKLEGMIREASRIARN